MKNRLEKGYSLIEALVVVALIGIVLAVTIAALSQFLQEYRMSVVARQLSSAISLARLKAVSTNMNYTMTINGTTFPSRYQTTGTNDINGNSTLEPWEDVFGTGLIATDALYDSPQSLEHAKIDHVGYSGNTLPNGAGVSLAMDNGTTLTIVFNGSGVVRSMNDGSNNKSYILLQNGTITRAIFVEPTGIVRVYKANDTSWAELR